MKTFVKQIKADVKIEIRDGKGIIEPLSLALLLSVCVSFLCAGLPESAKSAACTLSVFFISSSTLTRIFSRDKDRGCSDFIRMHSSPQAVFASRTFFNCGLSALSGFLFAASLVFFSQSGANPLKLATASAATGFALSLSSSFCALVSSGNAGKNALFAAINIPVSFPLIAVSFLLISDIYANIHLSESYFIFMIAFSLLQFFLGMLLCERIEK